MDRDNAHSQSLFTKKKIDFQSDEAFDKITEIASAIFRVPISYISFINKDQIYFKSAVGFELKNAPKETSLFEYVINQNNICEIEDCEKDFNFKNNPLVSGSPKIIFFAGIPFKGASGDNIGILCIADRVSRRISDDEKLLLMNLGRQVELLYSLRLGVEELKSNIRGVEIFIQDIVHDINNPLAIIDLGLNILKDPDSPEKIRNDMTNSALKSCERLNNLLDGLFTFKVSYEKKDKGKDKIHLKSMIREIVDEMKSMTSIEGIFFKVEKLSFASLNEKKVTEVLKILISNAIKHGEKTDINIFTKAEDSFLFFEVSDTGPGIFGQLKEDIFVKNTNLRMCKEIVENILGGKIWVEDNQPNGSKFIFTIPLK